MLKKIMFKEEVDKEYTYNGRNGHSKCLGIELLAADSSDRVHITPVNSRGPASTTFIEIPKEPEVLRALAKALGQVADTVDPCHVQTAFSPEDIAGFRPHWADEMKSSFFESYASSLKEGLVHDGNERLLGYLEDFETGNGKCQAWLTVSPEEAQQVADFLSMTDAVPDAGRDEKLLSFTVAFDLNVEAVLNIVNSESGPYLDAILFDSGSEAGVLEPCLDELVGSYVWDTDYGKYELIVERAG